MTRRVIFVDPELWTNHKEPNMNNPDDLDPRDIRMAAALIKHHRYSDHQGIAAIATDPDVIQRGTPLLLGILELHKTYIVQTRTSTGVDYLGTYVQNIAAAPLDGAEDSQLIRWACQLIDAHGRDDITGMNTVLNEARATNQCTHVLLGVLNVFNHAVPDLSSAPGAAWLEATAAAMLNQEAEGDQ